MCLFLIQRLITTSHRNPTFTLSPCYTNLHQIQAHYSNSRSIFRPKFQNLDPIETQFSSGFKIQTVIQQVLIPSKFEFLQGFLRSMASVQKLDSLPDLYTPTKNKKTAVESLHDNDDDDDDSPLRPIFCLKRRSAIKEFDQKEDCFILDFNPDEDSFDLSKISVEKDHHNNPQDSPDISLIAEKGKVACRDYPHSRHLCVKNPFEKTDHESYCKLCYCYVCDVAAPCKSWSGVGGHCHALDTEGWKFVRDCVKKGITS